MSDSIFVTKGQSWQQDSESRWVLISGSEVGHLSLAFLVKNTGTGIWYCHPGAKFRGGSKSWESAVSPSRSLHEMMNKTEEFVNSLSV